MAKIEFLLQGLDESQDHYAALEQLLGLPNISHCLICVAFMNAAGAAMMSEKLAAFSDKLQLFIGIRNGVTSKQSIEVLQAKNIYPICVDTATQSFIFHPKVYLAQNQTSAVLITGSANFTSGGLIKNIEASVIANLDLTCGEDLALSNKIIKDFETLQNRYPQNIFQMDSAYDLDKMVQQGLLEDETLQQQRINAKAQLTQGRTEQRPCMKTHVRKLASTRRSKAQKSANITVPFSITSFAAITNSQLLWKSGALTRRDLNIPTGTNTHATGSMLLKVGDPSQNIDQRHYFRDVVFSTASWKPDLNPKLSHIERCFLDFRIIIKGIDYGIHKLKLSHNTRTDTETYRQKNSMTQIHWGDVVKTMIAHEDLLDGILCIYAPENASDVYTLTFDIE
ncbi:hypothetical protein BN3590_03599 [Clostridium sp. C105KSO15]|nr:hypothetical protein BN3590_03599 [Clostridium sp. C105KSO15]